MSTRDRSSASRNGSRSPSGSPRRRARCAACAAWRRPGRSPPRRCRARGGAGAPRRRRSRVPRPRQGARGSPRGLCADRRRRNCPVPGRRGAESRGAPWHQYFGRPGGLVSERGSASSSRPQRASICRYFPFAIRPLVACVSASTRPLPFRVAIATSDLSGQPALSVPTRRMSGRGPPRRRAGRAAARPRRPARAQGDEARGLVVEELQVDRLQARRHVLPAPLDEDALLVGAAADADRQPGRVLRLSDMVDPAVGAHEEAVQALPVGREVELLLALLGDADIRDHRVIAPRGETERPVGPGHRDEGELQPKAVGDELGEVGIRADDGFRIGRVGAERGAARVIATVRVPGSTNGTLSGAGRPPPGRPRRGPGRAARARGRKGCPAPRRAGSLRRRPRRREVTGAGAARA